MQVIPKNKWIVIQPQEESGTAGTIILVGGVNGSYKLAKVTAVPYPKVEEADYGPGDTIVYDSLGVVEVRINEQKVFFVKAVNVLGVVK